MSLNKQLWLAIAILISMTFIGGVAVSSYYARDYYVDQLAVKNIDNANSLALSMSQLEKDPVMLELMIAAQFDTGHYQRIELLSPDGVSLVRKVYTANAQEPNVPAWFARAMQFSIAPGVAQVQNGWHQYGTLYLESHSKYALQALWQVSCQLLYWFLLIAVICGVLGTLFLHFITKPLAQVVEQAEAIGGRRFITSEEPRTLEFNRVAKAMNRLSARVRQMLEVESQRLNELRQQSQQDPATGIANRQYFFNMLDCRLIAEDESAQNGLVLIRITDLAALNQQLGRLATDRWIMQLLHTCHTVLEQHKQDYSEYLIGRLNGSDFAILFSDTEFLAELNLTLFKALQSVHPDSFIHHGPPLAQAAGMLCHGEARAQLMARLDAQLAIAEQSNQGPMLCSTEQKAAVFSDAHSWKQALDTAIKTQQVSLQLYPVTRINNDMLHMEAMLRLNIAGQSYAAGSVIGWAKRLGMLPQLDLLVMKAAIEQLKLQPDAQIAVNLSVDTLTDTTSHLALSHMLQQTEPLVRQRLAIELNEHAALTESNLFTVFSKLLKQLDVQLGLQAAGNAMNSITGIEQLGLDYLKVDAALIRQSDVVEAQAFLRGLCSFGHSLGLLLIAEGVAAQTDIALLATLGFDGITGPAVLTNSQ